MPKQPARVYLCIFLLIGSIKTYSQPLYQTYQELSEKFEKAVDLYNIHFLPDSSLAFLEEIEQQARVNRFDTLLLKTLTFKSSILYQSVDSKGAYAILDEALELSEQLDVPKYEMEVLIKYGTLEYIAENTDEAISYFERALEIAHKLKIYNRIVSTLGRLASASAFKGDRPLETFSYYLNAVDIIEQHEIHPLSAGLVYVNLANAYRSIGLLESSMKYNQKWIQDIDKVNNDKYASQGFANYSVLLSNMGMIDSSLSAINTSLRLANKTSDEYFLPFIKLTKGDLLVELMEFDSAKIYLREALKESETIEDDANTVYCHIALADLFLMLDQPDSAWNHLQKAQPIVNQLNSLIHDRDMAEANYKYYKYLGDENKALDQYETYITLKDSVSNDQLAQQMGALEAQFKLDRVVGENQSLRKENELAALQADVENRKLQATLIVVAFVIVLIIILGINRTLIKKTNRALREQNYKLYDLNATIKSKQDELQLTAERLRISNETKDKFFSIVAHDLKSPITTLNNLLHILSREGKASTPQMRQRAFQELTFELSSVSALLDNLLYWALQQKEKIEAKEEPVDITQLIKEMNEIYRIEFELKKVSFCNKINDQLITKSDPNILQFILRNLISNSLKFTPSGGSVSVAADRENESLKISIVDTGIGIDDSKRETIFKGEYSKRGTNNEEGVGLGLSLCKEFADKINANLDFENNENGGATFTLILN